MSNELARINASLPAFMWDEQETGMDNLAQYIVPPRLKVTQPTSKGIFGNYPQGTVLLMPQALPLIEYSPPDKGLSSLVVTPIFFFAEYVILNALDTAPTILDRSFDPNSKIAELARDPKRRVQPHPEIAGKEVKYCEHLNYAVLLNLEGMERTPAIMTFARAEHYAGRVFGTNISTRKPAPIYGCNFVAVLQRRENSQGKWFGFDMINPPADFGVSPWVENQEQYAFNRALHLELKEAFEANRLQVDFEDGDIGDVDANGGEGYSQDAF